MVEDLTNKTTSVTEISRKKQLKDEADKKVTHPIKDIKTFDIFKLRFLHKLGEGKTSFF